MCQFLLDFFLGQRFVVKALYFLTLSDMKTQLQAILDNESNTIRAYVAELALDFEPGPLAFFQDLFRGGCASGFIGGLIYYTDTWAFFDAYYDEINVLREKYEESTGEPLRIQGDLKNYLAWFGFESTAFNLASEIGFDV